MRTSWTKSTAVQVAVRRPACSGSSITSKVVSPITKLSPGRDQRGIDRPHAEGDGILAGAEAGDAQLLALDPQGGMLARDVLVPGHRETRRQCRAHGPTVSSACGDGGLGDMAGLQSSGAHAEDRRQQAHLAEVGTAREVGEHQFAAGEDLRDLHEAHADQVERIGDFALAADDLAGHDIHQFHAVAQVVPGNRR